MKYVIFGWSVTLFNGKDKITRMIKYFNWQNKKKSRSMFGNTLMMKGI